VTKSIKHKSDKELDRSRTAGRQFYRWQQQPSIIQKRAICVFRTRTSDAMPLLPKS